MGATQTFNVTEAAKAMLSDPIRYGTVIAPALTPEQHKAVAVEVANLQRDNVRAEGIKAMAAAKWSDGVDDAMKGDFYDALCTVASYLEALTERIGDSDGGWSGYSVGRRAIPVPGGRIKVTLTV